MADRSHPRAHTTYQREIGGFDESTPYSFRTPRGTEITKLLQPGCILVTNYDSGPYVLVKILPPFTHRFPEGRFKSWDLHCDYLRPPHGRTRKWPEICCYLNDYVAVDGRLLQLFENNDDEVLIKGLDDEAARRIAARNAPSPKRKTK